MKIKPKSTWYLRENLKRKRLTTAQAAEVDRYIMQALLKMGRPSPSKFSNNMPNSIGRILKDLTEGMWIIPRMAFPKKAFAKIKIKDKLCRQEALLFGAIWLSIHASLHVYDLSWVKDLSPRQQMKCLAKLARAARKSLLANFNKLREGLRLPIFMDDMADVYYSWKSTARSKALPGTETSPRSSGRDGRLRRSPTPSSTAPGSRREPCRMTSLWRS
jgi:hypothetical protein